MRRILVPAVLSAVLALSACNFGSTGTTGGDASSSEASSEGIITRNVSYTGTLEKLEASTYQQGTHSLTLSDGQFLVVESTDENLSLDSYIGKKVEIRGSVQATVEEGGMLLRAEEITVLEDTSSSSSESSASSKKFCGGIAAFKCDDGEVCVDDPSDSCDPMNGGADCGGMCIKQLIPSSSSSVASSVAASSKAASSVKSSVASSAKPASSSSSAASSVAPAANAEMEAQIVLMAKQTYTDASLWTQKYCTSHVAFCISVHKNWYFKSFGATTSNQWHVEFGMVDIDALGQGAIVMNLVSGSSASMQASDGQIKTQGSEIIGFKDWQDGHFEIIADARLKGAVEYMLSSITSYNPAQ